MRRFTWAVALLAVAGFAAGASAGTPPDPPRAYPPEQAQALMNTPAQGPSVAHKRPVRPDAVPGLSKFQKAKYRLMGYGCWFVDGMMTQWGTWPYDQRVYEERYWCGYYEGGGQTYRSSRAFGGTTWCGWSNPAEYRIEGGNGWNYTVVRSRASFSCPSSIPWITFHSDRWQDWHCDTYTWTPCRRINNSG